MGKGKKRNDGESKKVSKKEIKEEKEKEGLVKMMVERKRIRKWIPEE